jgi:hypothetical protein
MDWHRLLSFCLWVSPHALLAVVAVLIYRRRLYREFPVFLVYTLYEIVEFVVLFTLVCIPSITGRQYAYAYLATLVFSIALRFGVVEEVVENLFRDHQFLKALPNRQLRWIKIVLASAALLFAAYAPANGDRLMGGVFMASRGVAMIQCGLLLFLLCFSRFFGLSWRNYAFGIAFGLGILSTADLATFALRAELGAESWTPFLNTLTTGSYLVCVLVWLGYLPAPERKPALLPSVPAKELEDWNSELQQLLRP